MKIINILLILSILIVGCRQGPQEATNKVEVMTTLYPLYEFAKEVGGDKANVQLLLPPGAEPHTYELIPSDIIKLTSADIFFYIGAGMEPWAKDLIDGAPNPRRINLDASTKVKLLKSEGQDLELFKSQWEGLIPLTPLAQKPESEQGKYDPHFWLDFENDKKLTDAIAKSFIQKDPKNKEYYLTNAQSYNLKLDNLDTNYQNALNNCKKKEFITGGHNAYAYLAHRYNISFVSAFEISPDSEPTPKKIKEIADLAKEHNIKYVLFEELVSPRMSQAIAQQAQAKTLVFNPGHNLLKNEFDEGKTFISLMEGNLISLKAALECD